MSPWTQEITHPAETPNGETPVRRNVLSPHALSESPHPSIRTVYDLIQFNGRRHGDAPCFGTRKVKKVHVEKQVLKRVVNGVETPVEKSWMFWELGPFEYRSYKEVAVEGLTIGHGLSKLGLEKGDKIALYADTSYDRLAMRLTEC
jgi:long-chain acyl-CoA synthetase